jgi:hypothetical protein
MVGVSANSSTTTSPNALISSNSFMYGITEFEFEPLQKISGEYYGLNINNNSYYYPGNVETRSRANAYVPYSEYSIWDNYANAGYYHMKFNLTGTTSTYSVTVTCGSYSTTRTITGGNTTINLAVDFPAGGTIPSLRVQVSQAGNSNKPVLTGNVIIN